MLIAEIEKALRLHWRGNTLLSNLRVCVDANLVQPDLEAKFGSYLATWAFGRTFDPDLLFQNALRMLGLLAGMAKNDELCQLRYATNPHGTDLFKVMTWDTLGAHYLADETDIDSLGLPISVDPFSDTHTDVEFDLPMPPIVAVQKSLLPSFSLCQPGRTAFVAPQSALSPAGITPLAKSSGDRAVTILGLPYPEGERLAMLCMQSSAISDWTKLRRPTLFDAIDHAWFVCWKDDGPEFGHTLDLAGLSDRPPKLVKGSPEWVIDGQSIDSTADKVTYLEFAKTGSDTRPNSAHPLWAAYCTLT